MRALSPILLLLLSGCWLSAREVRDKFGTGTDTDTDVGSMIIGEVRPVSGTSAGGTEVVIQATPLTGELSVRLGGQPATVIDHTPTSVTVTSPAGEPGWADIVIEAGKDHGRATDGWYYWPDGQGKTGVIGSISWYSYAGTYWEDTPDDWGRAWLSFTVPVELEYWELYATSLDRCESGYQYSFSTTDFYEPGASSVSLVGTEAELILEQDDVDPTMYALDFAEGWEPDSSYDLLAMDGTPPWPDLAQPDLVGTPPGFSLFQPAIAGTYPPTVRQELELEWSDAGAGDFMVAILYRYSGDTVAEIVKCAMVDDGSFTIDRSVWDSWSSGSQLTVVVGRARVSPTSLAHNRASSQVAGVQWIVGAAYAE